MAVRVVALCALLPLAASQPSLRPAQRQLRGANVSSNVSTDVSANLGGNMSALAAYGAAPAHLAYALDPSYCLSSDGNRVGNGVKIHLWKCDDTWRSTGQNFLFGTDGRIRVRQNPSYCVVTDGDRHENGAQIQLWRCDEDNHHQAWYSYSPRPGKISRFGSANMCLVIDGNRPHNGAKIQLWACSDGRAQDWMTMQLAPGGRVAYAVPSVDQACPRPFMPVDQSRDACSVAAEVLRPGEGCRWSSSPLFRWAELVEEVDKPLWPRGCYFRGACQGGCGLSFNPTGHTDGSYPGAGNCQSIQVICQRPVA